MNLHLRHEALRLNFQSAIWMVREIEGLLVHKNGPGWEIGLSDPDEIDSGFGPHHPLAGDIYDRLCDQSYSTRQELLQAISAALVSVEISKTQLS